MNIEQYLAKELNIKESQVIATITLLDSGATVPFIARYRKEQTGSLDDQILRQLDEKLIYLRELNERKKTILSSIAKQDKLTAELEKNIDAIDNKTQLEDIYRPFKPKRRTKAQIAREAGLEPLAMLLLKQQTLVPAEAANDYLNSDAGVPDSKAALEGAKQIIMEIFAEDAKLIGQLRQSLLETSTLQASVVAGKKSIGGKFKDYFDYQESISKIPSHRAMAILRGRREGILSLKINTDNQVFEQSIIDHFKLTSDWLLHCAHWSWQIKILPHLELDLINQLREQAEADAIHVFSKNLHDLLMAAPAGMRITLGLDPGLRTGVKAVVVNQTGKLLATEVIYPHVPHKQWQPSIVTLLELCRQHKVELIAIGNGTASRETEQLVSELIDLHPELNLTKIMISEAGASVYSASELAAKEFPELDVAMRGAISIARRLQDPLAELVKIDPKSIGVGQYQHDVNQAALTRTLNNVVEDCVNAVGVDVNTASVPLLKQISGLNQTSAENIVAYRDEHGPFKSRQLLKNVPQLGEKTFEQAAGFLRITGGDNPLDSSAVHPEAYPLVNNILTDQQLSIEDLIGNKALLKKIPIDKFINEKFGLPTVRDIFNELEKPGRDPRPDFKNAAFKKGIEKPSDLAIGMRLEGVITNVADFGAFVDIGVHQDGLIHISELSNQFVKDPRTIVRAGDIVTVRVLSVDLERKRINLTLKAATEPSATTAQKTIKKPKAKPNRQVNKPKQQTVSAFGNALQDAIRKTK